MQTQYLNEQEIYKAITTIKQSPSNGVFEIRIIRNDRKNPTSAYFNNPETAIKKLREYSRNKFEKTNVYITLNELHPQCYDRVTRDTFMENVSTTSESDVIGRDWLFIDVDPRRPSHTSATKEQVTLAHDKAQVVLDYLRKVGFSDPVIAFSGNGYHLLYRVSLANTKEVKTKVKKFLEALDRMFSDRDIKIDTANQDASRVCKLYGTLAQKGLNTEQAPYRMSKILYVPEKLERSKVDLIDVVINEIPETTDEKPSMTYNRSGQMQPLELSSWLDNYGIDYYETDYPGGHKYILDHCFFDSGHKGKDACLFQYSNGAIKYKCFHDSCQDKGWKDVRVLFEPDAYQKKYEERDNRTYHSYNRNSPVKIVPKHIEETPDEPIFETAKQVIGRKEEEQTFVKTGITEIDKRMSGLVKGGITLLSGMRASGKTSILSEIALNAIDDGNRVGCFSGEMKDSRFFRWMILQAAGKSYAMYGGREGVWNVPRMQQEQIADWLDGKFWLYNNKYGNDFTAITEQFEKLIVEKKLDLLILDNLMAFNTQGLSPDKYEAQSKFVLTIVDLAHKYNIHCLFVAHPKKSNGFLRLDDVSGTADLSNAVDNAFIIHRTNHDFKVKTREEFEWNENDAIYDSDNVIEIVKDRENGNQDIFIPLYFEKETRRLKNDRNEYRTYGWSRDANGFTPIATEIEESEIPFRP